MPKSTDLLVPVLLACCASGIATASASAPAAYSKVISLGETPRKPLPREHQATDCEDAAAAAAYHRPAQTGVVNPCTGATQDAAGSQGVPITVRSAP